MPRPRRPKAAESAEAATSTETAKSAETAKSIEFVCPECGRTFTRAASLGAHRRQTHRIPGATKATQAAKSSTATPSAKTVRRRRARARSTTVPASSTVSIGATNRDALLGTLFPNGIPANESVIRSLNAWLDEADRLARLR